MRRSACLLPLLVCAAVLVPSAPALAATNCSDFSSQKAAHDYYNAQTGDPDGLDRDGDGWACESNPAPRASAPKGAAAPPASSSPAPTPTPDPSPAPSPTPAAQKALARVLSVIDGDTIKVRTASGRRLTVRLIGIDAPETRKPGRGAECGRRQATEAMRKLLLTRRGGGRVVMLTTDPTQDTTDRYGRILAYVNVARTDVGRSMVKKGWARVYVFEDPFERLATFTSAQSFAKNVRRGVWGQCGGDFHRLAR